MNYPENWAVLELQELGEWKTGSTPRRSNDDFWGGDILWVSPKDMKTDRIEDTQDKMTNEALEETNSKLIPENSLIIVTRSGILEHSFPVAITQKQVTINQDLKAFITGDRLDERYAYYFLRAYELDILRTCTKDGTTVASINSDCLYSYKIPVPSLAHQERLVTKIEELFSKLDSGVSELAEVSQRFVQYRRSVLRNAMRGKLTENWRTESKVDNQRENILNDVEPLSDERVNQLYDVPESWVWTKFGEIVEKSRNGFSKRSGEDGIPTPVLRLADIKQGKIEYSDPRYIRMINIERDKYLLESGDLLCTRVNGSENLVGRLAVFDEDGDWAFCDHFIRYKLKEFAIPRFVDMWFDSSSARRYVQSNMVSTAGQNTVSQTTMEEAPMPLCSIEEQEKIMERIDQRISVIEYLISTTDQVQTKAKSLRESILEQAFNNELLRPNPTEEPIPPDSGDTDLEQGLQTTSSEVSDDGK